MLTTIKRTRADTMPREPWLSRVDTVGVVDLASRLRRQANNGFVNGGVEATADSFPLEEAQVNRLPQVYEFTIEGGSFVIATRLNSGSKLVEIADVDEFVATVWARVARTPMTEKPTDPLDWDVRIENPPRKQAKVVTMDFIQAGHRKPRIRENPCD